MSWIQDGSLFTDTRFKTVPNIVQFTTCRECGHLKNPNIRKSFIRKYPFAGWALCEQVHGNAIETIHAPFTGETVFPRADGLITRCNSVALGIFTADCVPVFFADRTMCIVGAAHAGWKGVRAEIVPRMIGIMVKDFAVAKKDIIVSLGPHIRSCCYDRMDLDKEIVRQLHNCGIAAEHICVAPWCTADHTDLFFSFRKEDGTEKRLFSVIGTL